ncbi:MAG: hypothetical protein K2N81_02310, partial [Acetatifactor sp.]|nr:hypothetical protein [Acetatifactor sp.]
NHLSLFGAQRAVNKVILHIHNHKYFHKTSRNFRSLMHYFYNNARDCAAAIPDILIRRISNT